MIVLTLATNVFGVIGVATVLRWTWKLSRRLAPGRRA